MRNKLLIVLLVSAGLHCGPISPTTKTTLTDVGIVADNPATCTFISALDSDPTAALVCKGVEGVISTVVNGILALTKAKGWAPSKSYHAITVPGDKYPTAYLREDLWSLDVEVRIVNGIKEKRAVQ